MPRPTPHPAALVLCAWSIAASACSSPGRLVVELRTDLAPEREFSWVRLEFANDATIDVGELRVSEERDALAGFRIAELEDMAPGDHRFDVVLLDARDQEVIRRPVQVRLLGSTIVTVVITRDCRNVVCPAGDPSAIACLGGRCVDPTCTDGAGDGCGPRTCSADVDCVSDVACGTGECRNGVCLEVPIADRCVARDRCDLDRGCVPDVERWSLATGMGATCVSRGPDDTWCWGSNGFGLVSDAPARTVLTPTAIPNAPPNLAKVGAGGGHTCVTDTAGALHCWGRNRHGQLGDGTLQATARPSGPVAGLRPITSFALGRDHTCAIDDTDALYCWGANGDGQLGLGTRVDAATPQQVPGIGRVQQVAAGSDHTCALTTAGAVHCWGRPDDARLGHAGDGIGLGPALAIPTALAIAVHETNGCAIDLQSRVHCWGDNDHGQLGVGDRDARTGPVGPVVGLGRATSIAVGRWTACAAVEDGRVFCWGRAANGELGAGYGLPVTPAPSGAVTGVDDAVAVRFGDRTAFAIRRDGSVFAWGADGEAESGLGSLFNRHVPERTSLAGVTDLAAGTLHACAIAAGALRCWGGNDNGQLGLRTASSAPQPVVAPHGIDRGASMHGHGCGIDGSGSLRCWGRNQHGQLGNGGFAAWAAAGAVVDMPPVREVVVGVDHTCALAIDGSVRCWGTNWAGMLGDGGTDVSATPVTVPLPPIASIGTAHGAHFAVEPDGRVWAWGYEFDRVPRRILGLAPVRAIAGTWGAACAVQRGGALVCWYSDAI